MPPVVTARAAERGRRVGVLVVVGGWRERERRNVSSAEKSAPRWVRKPRRRGENGAGALGARVPGELEQNWTTRKVLYSKLKLYGQYRSYGHDNIILSDMLII